MDHEHADDSCGRVLIIDDEPRIVQIVCRCLTAEGYRVEGAANGVTGLAKAVAQDYALVLLDLVLPDGGGIEVLRRLREQKPGLSVVVISSSPDRALIEECLQLGATFLAKPFTLGELLAVVRARSARGQPNPDSADPGIGAGR